MPPWPARLLTLSTPPLWLIAGLMGVVGWHEASLLAFGVAGAATSSWLVVRLRLLANLVGVRADRLEHQVGKQAAQVARVPRIGQRTVRLATLSQELLTLQRGLRREQMSISQRLDALRTEVDIERRAVRALGHDLHEVLVSVQRTPSATQELGRLYDRLVDHDHPMPELGDWAMTASTLVWIADRIATGAIRTIVECGSGSSTVWFAAALENRGGAGRIVSLESSAEYAATTRGHLECAGLAHRAEVLHAPLVDTSIPGRDTQPWFDLSNLPASVTAIDLLFVDGPVGGLAREARYPAFPLLADRLSAEAIVVLDDTGRPDEASIAEQWQRQPGRHLTLLARMDRALAFTVVDE